jgi:isocitrate dehydrogenase kinase/phosphatase
MMFWLQVSKQSGVLVVERARYILQLNKQQVSAFEDKMVDIVTSAGWQPTQRNDVEGATDDSYAHDVHAMFKRG